MLSTRLVRVPWLVLGALGRLIILTGYALGWMAGKAADAVLCFLAALLAGWEDGLNTGGRAHP